VATTAVASASAEMVERRIPKATRRKYRSK
jgi:hypothetical protein